MIDTLLDLFYAVFARLFTLIFGPDWHHDDE